MRNLQVSIYHLDNFLHLLVYKNTPMKKVSLMIAIAMMLSVLGFAQEPKKSEKKEEKKERKEEKKEERKEKREKKKEDKKEEKK